MGFQSRRAFQGRRAMAFAIAAATVFPVTAAYCQTKAADKSKAAQAAPKADGMKAYGAGTRAYEGGRAAEAVTTLTSALSAGGLQPSQMAKALYYRGMSQKKLGKPALAISDLTSAIWLKGGLSDTDRANAIQARQQAHKEAGLGDTAPPVPEQQTVAAAPAPTVPVAAPAVATAPAVAAPSVPAPVATAAPVVAAPPVPSPVVEAVAPAPVSPVVAAAVETSSVPDAASLLSGNVPPPPKVRAAVAPPVAAMTAPVAAAPVFAEPVVAAAVAPVAEEAMPWKPAEVTPVEAPVQTTTPSVSAPALGLAPAAEAETPAPSSASPLANAGKAVSGFFGNIGKGIGSMFSANSNPEAATASASSPVATSATSANAQPQTSSSTIMTPKTQDLSLAAPQSSGWGTSTITPAAAAAAGLDVKPGKQAKAEKATKPAAATPKKVAAAGGAGNFKLQVAAVRSREEAEKISSTVSATPAVQTTQRMASIDEANIAGMGTYYRVRLGPFNDAAEPGRLCNSLKPQGYDCMVVAQ